ncbi:quinoprotein dehydrogenase-associated SoxYZ-like carrier [Altererythrobacter sp.]|uniref:quinoprotein dehydrogenase-associated SoxYZ-like carrier n=1 Tax=Altererythrobacter sp. TaxID=1872480 RepID=UPI003D127DF1
MFVAPSAAMAGELPADPLGSPMWEYRAGQIFDGAPVVFDEVVSLSVPMIAENQHALPVTVDARALDSVERIVLFADLNPIPIAVDYRPLRAQAFVATRIKLDQRTPVRAAVLTSDGVWHMSGEWVDAAGGGCSAPPVSRVKGDWADHLGEMRGAAWAGQGETRIRFGFRHPMDTGLVENIPAYNIDTLSLADDAGVVLGEMTIYGSVSEDPAFTLVVGASAGRAFRISAHDSGGLEFGGTIGASSGRRLAAAVQ